MKLGEFAAVIPEGKERADGYVEMRHGQQYTLRLTNYSIQRCDAEVMIDGGKVGLWRVDPGRDFTLDRPVHDTGKFTFYRADSEDGRRAGILKADHTGLISVTFKPEREYEFEGLHGSRAPRAGGTGLSGESKQRFSDAPEIHYDHSRFITINLRLIDASEEPRPLFPRSTPIPPPLP